MKIIARPRQAGKTTDLIKLAAEHFAYIVCVSHEHAYQLATQARAAGLDIPFPLTFDEFIEGRFFGKGVRGFVIDDVDMLLSRMAHGVPVLAMSATTEDPGPPPI